MKKKWTGFFAILMMITFHILPGWAASPWTTKPRYRDRMEGKFVFGLKHTLFSWMNPWAEANDPVYETPWTGFCVGIGKSVIYTAAGMIQLVTFPIPIDFPDIGQGMHIPASAQSSGGKKSVSTAKNLKTINKAAAEKIEPKETAPAPAANPASKPAELPEKVSQEKIAAVPASLPVKSAVPAAVPALVQAGAPAKSQPTQTTAPLADTDQTALMNIVK